MSMGPHITSMYIKYILVIFSGFRIILNYLFTCKTSKTALAYTLFNMGESKDDLDDIRCISYQIFEVILAQYCM